MWNCKCVCVHFQFICTERKKYTRPGYLIDGSRAVLFTCAGYEACRGICASVRVCLSTHMITHLIICFMRVVLQFLSSSVSVRFGQRCFVVVQCTCHGPLLNLFALLEKTVTVKHLSREHHMCRGVASRKQIKYKKENKPQYLIAQHQF